MKILSVSPLPPHRGGSAVSCGLLLSGFAAAGHALRVLSPLVADSPDGDAFAVAHPDIEVTRFPVPFEELSPNLPAGDAYRDNESRQIRALLPELIRRQRPDLVFIGRETFAYDALEIARAHAIPSVLRIAGAMAIGMLHRTLPEIAVRHLVEQFRHADLLICPAEHLAARLRPFQLPPIQVIRNAVDTARFSPAAKAPALLQRWNLTERDIVVAHASNLKTLKRPLDLVESATSALRRDSRLRYLVIGHGPTRQQMEDECHARSIADSFRFTGWIGHEQMPDYLNLADLVVMPAEDETQARVYLETQACGRVLLASDIAAAREVVVDNDNGVLFRKGDVADLVAKTLQLASDPERRARIGRSARARVAVHALPAVVRDYLTALAGVGATA
ncbi:MAG: glycosyltransferase family 4 protein [bacterium]